ncbi:restriction endonuclease subunit S [Brevibacillus halotolerans]|uniref:restriction endonuclease subunit S n=1 Tax=Brevibacillus halotolerans TaxID=1507437 RepID=UPI0015EE506F|nr:restriction endonuclease subunit S [Brevibacillus halotolerans]MBA4532548.1 restriction endonuclease subunit S [Brevibacillus halotolerans]
MSEKITKSPPIRFAGFTDAWEQCKLGEVLVKNSKKNKDLAIENVESVSNKTGFTKQTEQFGDYSVASADLSNYYVIREKQFAYNPSRINVGSIAYKAEGEEKSVVSPLYVSFSTTHRLEDSYLWNWVKTSGFERQRQTLSEGGVRDTLSFNQLAEMYLLAPNIEEQQKIGAFFKALDDTLTLHQRKLELLKDTKKSLLQKMFPEDGANVPEIRFEGFTDAWEQRKLGEVYTERKERGYDSLQILSVSIHHGVSNEELDTDTLGKKVHRSEDKSLYKHVYFGDLVLNMMRAWQGAIGVVKSEGMVSPAYITAIPSEQLYPLFMDYCLRRDEMIAQMDNLSYGVTDFRKRLYWDSFINVLCHIPSVPEQERITAFFTQLDHLITLHQRELNSLKNLKRSLLQQMFI